MIELTPEKRRALRARAHALQPVASIGQQGLTETVLKEISRALDAHELIKVKLHGAEREQRASWLMDICQHLDCAPVQHIGNILVLWREKPASEKSVPAQPAPRRRPAIGHTKKSLVRRGTARTASRRR